MLTLILCVMAAIAVHRIWHYESICAPVRAMLGAKLLIDPTWSGLWIAPLVASITLLDPEIAIWALVPLAGYPLLRAAVAVYEKYAPVCSPCEAKRKLFEAEIAEIQKFKKRIIFLNVDMEIVNFLATKHKTWVFFPIYIGKKPIEQRKNIRPILIDPTHASTHLTQTLGNQIMRSGSATVVTWLALGAEPWATAIKALSAMKATTWVHVHKGDPVPLPAHHRLIAPDEAVDKVIADL